LELVSLMVELRWFDAKSDGTVYLISMRGNRFARVDHQEAAPSQTAAGQGRTR
jgi:hypothetical protein